MTQASQLLEWRGRHVVDRHGRSIGAVDDVCFEAGSDEPRWLRVAGGEVARRPAYVPASGAVKIGERVWLPHALDQVAAAPVPRADGELSSDDDAALLLHYGETRFPSREATGARRARAGTNGTAADPGASRPPAGEGTRLRPLGEGQVPRRRRFAPAAEPEPDEPRPARSDAERDPGRQRPPAGGQSAPRWRAAGGQDRPRPPRPKGAGARAPEPKRPASWIPRHQSAPASAREPKLQRPSAPRKRLAPAVTQPGSRDLRRPLVPASRQAEPEDRPRFSLTAACLGWLVALGLGALLASLVAAAGAALGAPVSGGRAIPAESAIGLVLVLCVLLAYFVGGYMAGRISRYPGARQGLGVWAVALAVTLALAALGALLGGRLGVLDSLSLPRLRVDEGSLGALELATLIAIVVGSALAAALGGIVGHRHNRRAGVATSPPRP